MLTVQSQDALFAEMRADAREIHAAMARLAEKVAVVCNQQWWRGSGRSDCADWVGVELGFDPHNAFALVAAGIVAEDLPVTGGAFRAGEISLDKMRLMAPVIDAVEDASWAQYAQEVSPKELARTCTESRIARIPEHQVENAQRLERRLRFWTDDLKMIRISAAFAPEDGATVRQAIETLADGLEVSDPQPDRPRLAANADALAAICTTHLCGSSDAGETAERPVQLIVHADLDVLSGRNPRGRSHIEDGPAVSLAALKQIGCDASVKVLLERNGTPVAATTTKRRVPPAMRWKVQERDRTCVVPGCVRPAKQCQVHHLDFEYVSNPTEMWNLAALCKRCHRLLHLEEFSILRTPEGDLRFVGEDGAMLGIARGGWWKRPRARGSP